MARSISSLKRMRQNARRAARNKTLRSTIKTSIRKVNDAIAAKDGEASEKTFRQAAKVLDRLSQKGTIHRNTAARRKSRIARRVNAAKAAAK